MKILLVLFALQLGVAHASCEDLFAAESDMRAAVLKYGRSAFSFDVFEAPAKYRWFTYVGRHGRGGIAYREAYRSRVIVGDPLLPEEDWTDALKAFLAKRPAFATTIATFASADFARTALASEGAAIEAQNAVTVNPQTWSTSGPKVSQVRTCVRKAQRECLRLLTMKNMKEPEPKFREDAEKLVLDWKQKALKRNGNVHEVNLWEASEKKQYFALYDPVTNELQALVVARPLLARPGYYLWSARASYCMNGSLEATIAGALESLRQEGVTYVTFGPFQATRPHIYVENSGGDFLSRFALGNLVPAYVKYAGYDQTMNYFKKFNFDTSEPIYNLIWPRRAWILPYSALNKLFGPKRN